MKETIFSIFGHIVGGFAAGLTCFIVLVALLLILASFGAG